MVLLQKFGQRLETTHSQQHSQETSMMLQTLDALLVHQDLLL
jgi:hypothetical protein